ncbi:cytochrome c oxidase subunit II [Bacillus sp. Bva_UNVM-123]
MGVPNPKDKNKRDTESVKGTIFSVGVVGAVILITYFIMYGLYMVRI